MYSFVVGGLFFVVFLVISIFPIMIFAKKKIADILPPPPPPPDSLSKIELSKFEKMEADLEDELEKKLSIEEGKLKKQRLNLLSKKIKERQNQKKEEEKIQAEKHQISVREETKKKDEFLAQIRSREEQEKREEKIKRKELVIMQKEEKREKRRKKLEDRRILQETTKRKSIELTQEKRKLTAHKIKKDSLGFLHKIGLYKSLKDLEAKRKLREEQSIQNKDNIKEMLLKEKRRQESKQKEDQKRFLQEEQKRKKDYEKHIKEQQKTREKEARDLIERKKEIEKAKREHKELKLKDREEKIKRKHEKKRIKELARKKKEALLNAQNEKAIQSSENLRKKERKWEKIGLFLQRDREKASINLSEKFLKSDIEKLKVQDRDKKLEQNRKIKEKQEKKALKLKLKKQKIEDKLLLKEKKRKQKEDIIKKKNQERAINDKEKQLQREKLNEVRLHEEKKRQKKLLIKKKAKEEKRRLKLEQKAKKIVLKEKRKKEREKLLLIKHKEFEKRQKDKKKLEEIRLKENRELEKDQQKIDKIARLEAETKLELIEKEQSEKRKTKLKLKNEKIKTRKKEKLAKLKKLQDKKDEKLKLKNEKIKTRKKEKLAKLKKLQDKKDEKLKLKNEKIKTKEIQKAEKIKQKLIQDKQKYGLEKLKNAIKSEASKDRADSNIIGKFFSKSSSKISIATPPKIEHDEELESMLPKVKHKSEFEMERLNWLVKKRMKEKTKHVELAKLRRDDILRSEKKEDALKKKYGKKSVHHIAPESEQKIKSIKDSHERAEIEDRKRDETLKMEEEERVIKLHEEAGLKVKDLEKDLKKELKKSITTKSTGFLAALFKKKKQPKSDIIPGIEVKKSSEYGSQTGHHKEQIPGGSRYETNDEKIELGRRNHEKVLEERYREHERLLLAKELSQINDFLATAKMPKSASLMIKNDRLAIKKLSAQIENEKNKLLVESMESRSEIAKAIDAIKTSSTYAKAYHKHLRKEKHMATHFQEKIHKDLSLPKKDSHKLEDSIVHTSEQHQEIKRQDDTQISKKIALARDDILRSNLQEANVVYISIMKIYLQMPNSEKKRYYGEIKDLYEQKQALKIHEKRVKIEGKPNKKIKLNKTEILVGVVILLNLILFAIIYSNEGLSTGFKSLIDLKVLISLVLAPLFVVAFLIFMHGLLDKNRRKVILLHIEHLQKTKSMHFMISFFGIFAIFAFLFFFMMFILAENNVLGFSTENYSGFYNMPFFVVFALGFLVFILLLFILPSYLLGDLKIKFDKVTHEKIYSFGEEGMDSMVKKIPMEMEKFQEYDSKIRDNKIKDSKIKSSPVKGRLIPASKSLKKGVLKTNNYDEALNLISKIRDLLGEASYNKAGDLYIRLEHLYKYLTDSQKGSVESVLKEIKEKMNLAKDLFGS